MAYLRLQSLAKPRQGSVKLLASLLTIFPITALFLGFIYPNSAFIDPTVLILTSIPLYIFCVIIVFREVRAGNLLSPLSIFSITIALHFAFFAIIQTTNLLPFFNLENYSHVNTSMLFVNMAFLSYFIGYKIIKIRRRSHSGGQTNNSQKIGASAFVFWGIIGWLSRFYTIASGGYFKSSYTFSDIGQNEQGIIGLLNAMPDLMAAYFAYCTFSAAKSKKFKLLFILATIANVLYWGGAGMKQELIGSILMIFCAWYYQRKKLPSNFTLIAGGSIFVLYFTLNSAYRTAQESFTASNARNVYSVVEQVGEIITSPISDLSSVKSAMFRLDLTETISGAVRLIETNTLSMRMGQDYEAAIGALVPRLLWPDKPSIGTIGNDFGHWIGVLTDSSDAVTSISVTWLGESYLNFGFWGCLIFVLFGAASRWLYDILWSRSDASLMLIYAFNISHIAYVGTTMGITLNAIIKSSLLLIITLKLFQLIGSDNKSREGQ